jgi:hypothetical protein
MGHNETAIAIIGELIPITAIIMGVGIGMLSVYFDFRKKREMLQAYHAERMAAIEKGIEMPPLPAELLRGGGGRDEAHPARHRRHGLILLLLGIAVAGAMWADGGRDAWWGGVPAAIGVALLISSALESRERARSGNGGATMREPPTSS